MNFKEALIAHLQGEKVEFKEKGSSNWESFEKRCGWVKVADIDEKIGSACAFRLKPRTITVNGREVQAGETVAPGRHYKYWTITFDCETMADEICWVGDRVDLLLLERGLVHLTKEAAISHSKAMLNID